MCFHGIFDGVIHYIPLALASGWLVVPLVTLWRARHSPSLDDERAIAPEGAPSVSIVIPARNEERNIERCVRSALASAYPDLQVVAIDDHSTDATGSILREIAGEDARLRVMVPDPLPSGWFGKQWACRAGVSASAGEIIGFMDADTSQSPELVTRVVNWMRSHDADLVTVAGDQELGSFWEKLIQPQVFSVLFMRYGGPGAVNRSKSKESKIANGQCIFVRRDAYESLGGHDAVRDKVAEDLALAQLWFERGKRSFLVEGVPHLSTRMYTSLAEINKGWGKNIYAGGRESWPGGRFMQALYPMALLSPGLGYLMPVAMALLGYFGVVGTGWYVWGAAASLCSLLWWSLVYAAMSESPLYALLYPVGAAALLCISIGSIVRGRRVSWKDRRYVVT